MNEGSLSNVEYNRSNKVVLSSDIGPPADSLSVPLSAVITSYFDEKGPRQLPGLDYGPVAKMYESLVEKMVSLFPKARVFSSNPAARRSSHGFAVRRAMVVTEKVKKKSERHHHFSVLRQFHGRRLGTAAEKGGRYPIREMYFRNDGVTLNRAALTGVFVGAYAVVKAVLGEGGHLVNPEKIKGVKFYF